MSQNISAREWPGLLVRCAWARPLWLRLAGALTIGYTIVAVVDGGYALTRWLFGVLVALFGFALIASARRLTGADLGAARRRAKHEMLNPGGWMDWLFGRLPLRMARRVQAAAGTLLLAAGVALAVLSAFVL